MRYMIAALATALLVTSAQAGMIQTNCGRYGGTFNCTTQFIPSQSADAKVIEIPPSGNDDAKWVEFCKPTIHTDALGVGRYSYAHPGCEYGRTE